ncbi:MAG: SgcJ/EcaC family oxidoreductase [Syntrophales bacterium]
MRRSLSMKSIGTFALVIALALSGCAMNQSRSMSGQVSRTENCKITTESEIAALFDRWNRSLQTGDPHKVVANYAERSILLPTVSNKPRLTAAEQEDYFHHFLENRPSGKIDLRFLEIDCNTAVDAGLYTFTFAKTGAVVHARYTFTYRWDGTRWLITSHHSSAMPEKE